MKNRICTIFYSLIIATMFLSQPAWAVDLPFAANEGITGSWYDAGSSGQGFIIELVPAPANTILVYWFTYDPTTMGMQPPQNGLADHFWLVGAGTLNDNSADLSFSFVTGGVFDNGTPVDTDAVWASGTITFNSCTGATLSYTLPPAAGSKTGNITMTRVTPDVTCEPGGILPIPERYAGTFEGMWHNTTFGSTGGVTITVTYDAVTGEYDVTEDYDGNVFGGSNPAPIQSTVTPTGFGSSAAAFENDPVFGDCMTEYTDAGRFRGECTPPAFDLVTYEGVESPSHMSWTYEIMDNGQLFAEGTVVAWRTK